MIEHFINRNASIRNRWITGINLCAKADPSSWRRCIRTLTFVAHFFNGSLFLRPPQGEASDLHMAVYGPVAV
jgi:hypothetical protein